MKKMKRRGICLVLCLLLLAGMLPVNVFALNDGSTLSPDVIVMEGDTGETLLESNDILGDEVLLENLPQDFSVPSASYGGGDMYSQLSTRQKACYTALERTSMETVLRGELVTNNGAPYRRITLQINGFTGTSLSGVYINGSFSPSSAGAAVRRSLNTDLCAAIVALRYDRPDMLWINRMMYGFRISRSSSTTAVVTHALFEFNFTFNGQERAMQDTMMARARSIANQASAAPDTYSKVKTAHDLLAAGSTYSKAPDDVSHTAYSALISGDEHEPVCDGYSKAMKIVCDLMGIPCVLASSREHMWNNIKMDDGDWYNLDLTWDDSNEESISYNYFLIGSQTQIDNEVFSRQKDHIELNPYQEYYEQSKSSLNTVTLRYPSKNTKAYEYLGRDYPSPTFPDVRKADWFYEPVEAAAALGLFSGDDKGNFNPGRNIRRAEFVLVMANALHVDLSSYSGPSFSDVKEGQWYTSAVAWAKSAGVVDGYSDGTFRPNAPITRQEMCVILANTLKNKPELTGYSFPDDSSIASWAKRSVYECYALGLVKGNDKGYFTPRGNTLRSHAAVVFTNYATLDEQYLPAA